MNVIILASRTYALLGDVDRELAMLDATDHVLPFGDCDLVRRAAVVATARGLTATRRPLDTARRILLEHATQPDTAVWMFVARDPKTKQPTSGIADLQHLLTERGIAYRLISSPLPGHVSTAITELRHAVDSASKDYPEGRKRAMVQRALKRATAVSDLIDGYERKLAEGYGFEIGNPALDEKWCSWVTAYEALIDARRDAERLFESRVAA